jgi:hypothetical protein
MFAKEKEEKKEKKGKFVSTEMSNDESHTTYRFFYCNVFTNIEKKNLHSKFYQSLLLFFFEYFDEIDYLYHHPRYLSNDNNE